MKGKYVAQDLIQSEESLLVPEIRVWCHPIPNGDDFYYTFDTITQAYNFIKKHKKHKDFVPENVPLIAHDGKEYNIFKEFFEEMEKLFKHKIEW
jgi:hypothetical protein